MLLDCKESCFLGLVSISIVMQKGLVETIDWLWMVYFLSLLLSKSKFHVEFLGLKILIIKCFKMYVRQLI